MPGRIVDAVACDARGCYRRHIIVRGTDVSFISVERARQLERAGFRRRVEAGDVFWDPHQPKSDLRFPKGFVLVHDTTGVLLDRCDLYLVRERKGGAKNAPADVLADAESYYRDADGRPVPFGFGKVEIPPGSWSRVTRVRFIRYRRPGYAKPFEHPYEVPVDLRVCEAPLAWRLPLPSGCRVDDHGFVWP